MRTRNDLDEDFYDGWVHVNGLHDAVALISRFVLVEATSFSLPNYILGPLLEDCMQGRFSFERMLHNSGIALDFLDSLWHHTHTSLFYFEVGSILVCIWKRHHREKSRGFCALF